jgi:hypothetical protein
MAKQLGQMTVEELIALGFDRDTAQNMTKYSGSDGGSSLFAPILGFNYDKDDVLGDAGIAKKGEFISGYKINRKTLSVENPDDGLNLGKRIEFIVFASAYQYSEYDNVKNTTKVASNIFLSPFDAKKAVDLKTGALISDMKKHSDNIRFAHIIGMLVKVGDEWKPFAFYSRGTNHYEMNTQLEEQGIDPKDLPNSFKLVVESKKVPTSGATAWVMDVKEVTPLEVKDLIELKDVIAPNIKKFDNWVSSVNNVNQAAPTGSDEPEMSDSEREMESDEIKF